jgi:diguanylate cyclase (GGDEF)-like protein
MMNHAATGPVAIAAESLSRLMPMHICLSPTGIITGCGPTLRKLDPDRSWMGERFLDIFSVRRPSGILTADSLSSLAGRRLYLSMRNGAATGLRGIIQPLADQKGNLVNLSFGVSILEGVRRHHLTEADFAVTDLAVELLYLVEVKSALMEDLRLLNLRLHGAKTIAEEEAQTDTLTGLRNRRAMNAVLSAMIVGKAPFALMHLDLDFFKAVNDTLGHAAGDHVLCEVGQVLTRELRAGDTVARVGGDEFVMLLPGLSSIPKLEGIAQRIIQHVCEPISFEGELCRVSASIGMTVSGQYPKPSAAQMLADADGALYASKRAGRGQSQLFRPVAKDHAEPPV